jgi:glycine/D-amino acid oxidase-like deaminating enzyme/nitrite reductase/ring-hydroxylating ferredoxin subunit
MDNNNADGKKTSGTHESYWISDMEPLKYSPLAENIETDVVIVGAGISGLSVAYNLLKAGKKVVVAEDGFIGSGETGRTTAHLSNALDDRYYEIERIFGEDGAKLAAESHTAAIDFIESAVREENISCDFERVNGYLFLHPTDKEKNIEKELEAAKKAGVPVNRVDRVPHFKMNQNVPCIEFANQAQFHPMKYLRGLSEAIIAKGGKIFTETHVSKIEETGVETDGGHKISAAHVVVATNSPVNNKYVMHLKQYPYRTFVIAATIKKGSVPHLLWWDTGDHEINAEMAPYHYVRLQPYNEEYDLLISGGEDHPTGLPEAHDATESSGYAKLEGWTKARFDFEEIVYRWSGQVLEPMDAMGYIGRNPMDNDNIYIVTGDSGNGMTHGTIAGLLITDLITGKENPWEKLYDPSRTNFLKSGKTFLKEVVGGLFQYLKNSPDDKTIELSEMDPLEARVMKMGKEKYGVYRDENNTVHVVSATCTHLGCTVKWNSDETSWDCPCHGSRFSMEGKVLNGPAKKDLDYYKEEVK